MKDAAQLSTDLFTDGVSVKPQGDTVIVVWKLPATTSRWMHVFQQIQSRALASDDDGILVLYIILPSSSPPDSGLRVQIQRDFSSLGKKLRKMVVVPVGNGVWLSVVRTLARTILLVAGLSDKLIVAGSVREGIAAIRQSAKALTPTSEDIEQSLAKIDEQAAA